MDEPSVAHRPAARTLLKGGSSSFGGSFGSSGYHGGFSRSTSVSTRSYSYRGGSATRYYYQGCYSCSSYRYRRSYTYRYQEAAALAGRRIVAVGCYFFEPTCFPCDKCYKQPSAVTNPSQLGWEHAFAQARDLYELELPFKPPLRAQQSRWPLKTTLTGLTVYRPLVTREGGLTYADRSSVLHVSFTTGTMMSQESVSPRANPSPAAISSAPPSCPALAARRSYLRCHKHSPYATIAQSGHACTHSNDPILSHPRVQDI